MASCLRKTLFHFIQQSETEKVISSKKEDLINLKGHFVFS